MPERKPIGKSVRFKVFKRDGFSCQYCGATPPAVVLEVDHINPVSKGGGNRPDNLITACFACNRGKAATTLTDIPKSLADRAEEVAEREAQIKGYNKILQSKEDRIDSEAWRVAAELDGTDYVPRYNGQRMQSIRLFLEKLSVVEVVSAAKSTVAKFGDTTSDRPFRYFCGICWGKIREQANG